MLDYVALGTLIFVGLTMVYGIVFIHDIPYNIAKARNHPHQDAIHVAGWISMFTLHSIWPFLWIWATIYQPERGYGFGPDTGPLVERLDALEHELAELRAARAREAQPEPPAVPEAEELDETLELSPSGALADNKGGEVN